MSEPFDGGSIARQRIAEEAERRTGFLDLGGLGLAALPRALFRLRHLRSLNLGSGITREDGTWHEAHGPFHAGIPYSPVAAELGGLRQLPELRALSIASTPIADLTPLAGLTALQSLDCQVTRVGDLTPLAGLTALRSLDCSHTRVGDLTPLAGLTALQTLSCIGTQVGDLTPLAGLTALQSLECGSTQIGDLTPLAGLTALRSLDCSHTRGRRPDAAGGPHRAAIARNGYPLR